MHLFTFHFIWELLVLQRVPWNTHCVDDRSQTSGDIQRRWQSVVQACISSLHSRSTLKAFSSSHQIIWYHTFPGDTHGSSQTTPGWLTVWMIHYEASVMLFVWFNFVKKNSTWHNILLALASICCPLTWCTTTATTPAAPPHDAQYGACLIDHLGEEEEVNQNHFSFSFPGSFPLQLLGSITCISSVAEPLT